MTLVTGANGFVGRALVGQLQSRGERVKAATRSPAALPTQCPGAVVPSLGPETDWREALRNCSSVVHLAARVHIMDDRAADPLAAHREANTAGTLRLARQAADAGIRRFVFVSTVKVNGEHSPGRPFVETDPPAPVDPYGIAKAEAEGGLMEIASGSGMEVVIIRPPLVYGRGVRGNLASLARWLERGIPLPLGAIRQNRRSFIALGNLVDLIQLTLEHPAAANETFLACDGQDLSTTALLERTAAALGVPARLFPVPVAVLRAAGALARRTAMIDRLCGDLQVDASKARGRLGWNPPLSIDEGFARAFGPLPKVVAE